MQILITGMHRCGTSVITRLLAKCGCNLGRAEDLMPPKPDNPAGFFEHLRANEINVAVLEAAGVSWDTALGGEPELLSPALRSRFSAQILDFVGEMSIDGGVWGVKDPRLALTLPLWRPLLSDPVVVWCVRNPVEIGLSLEGRNGFPVHVGVALWEAYTIAGMNGLEGTPVVVASYADLLDDPVVEVRRIVASVNQVGADELTVPDDDVIREVVKPKLHRAVGTSELNDQYFTPHRQRLWKRARTAAGWIESAGPAPELSRLSKDIILLHRQLVQLDSRQAGAADPGSEGGPGGAGDRADERLPGLEERVLGLGDRCERILAEIDVRFGHLGREVANLSQRTVAVLESREASRSAIEAREAEVAQLRAELDGLLGRLEAESTRRSQAEALVDDHVREIETRGKRMEELEAAVADRERQLDARAFEIEECGRVLGELEFKLDEQGRELEEQGRELEERSRELERSLQKSAQLETTLEQRRRELEMRLREAEELDRSIEIRDRRLEEIRGEIEHLRSELERHQSALAALESSRLGRIQRWWWSRRG